MAGILGRIAQFILQNTSLDDLPAEVPARSKDMLTNAAAVGLAGAAQPAGIAVTRFAQEMRGNGKCTIIGRGLRTSPVYAALANATMVRLLDFDDEIAERKCHPGSFIFPVVMALGEMNGNSGSEVLIAFSLGCEVVSKLSGGPAGPGSHYPPPAGHSRHPGRRCRGRQPSGNGPCSNGGDFGPGGRGGRPGTGP